MDIETVDQATSITMYPFFDIEGKGISEIILTQFNSLELGNSRDIILYKPYSVIENYLPRKVNVLVVHDGSLDVVRLMVENGGFDELNDVGAVPEVVLIGIPYSDYGSACPSGSNPYCYQRTYELTPTDCDPTRNMCSPDQVYGGMDLYFDFVYDSVIPAVLDAMGSFELGEVSSVGFR